MEDLFNMLSSAAKLDKSRHQRHQGKRRQPKQKHEHEHDDNDIVSSSSNITTPHNVTMDATIPSFRSKNRDDSVTNNSTISSNHQQQVHREQMAAFRRTMHIKISNKHDPDLPDAISSFQEITIPSWWSNKNDTTKTIHNDTTSNKEDSNHDVPVVPTSAAAASTLQSFMAIQRVIVHNIEQGRWKEPTPIQMQAIPTLLQRRDLLACAPTGSGKSGAFIIPALILSHPLQEIYYYSTQNSNNRHLPRKVSNTNNDNRIINRHHHHQTNRQGEIRSLLLAPSRELAAQLHREVDRLGRGKPNHHHGSISSILLMKSNAAHVIAGTVGGKNGLDVLVTTPLRLIDALEKGLRLDTVRLVVLDEADRLLDAADGRAPPSRETTKRKNKSKMNHNIKQQQDNKTTNDSSSSTSSRGSNEEETSDDDEEEEKEDEEDDHNNYQVQPTSGSYQTQTFLAQMDTILSAIPTSAVRALFSATVTQTVKLLSESILRNPVDVNVSLPGSAGGGANTDIEQELLFVGREEGKLLALRQLKQRGQFKPPIIVFVQSQERAQALFGELLYDGFHVDVIHAGRSRTARDNAVAKFRRGETWVLICTDLVARGVDFKAVNMVINYDLPTSGITYVHRIGRCGRAGRHGRAITLFTEADFEHLRTIANVMKQSGCQVEEWMLQLKRGHHSSSNNNNNKKKQRPPPRRSNIDTTPRYDKKKRLHKLQMIQESKRKKQRTERKQIQQGQEKEV